MASGFDEHLRADRIALKKDLATESDQDLPNLLTRTFAERLAGLVATSSVTYAGENRARPMTLKKLVELLAQRFPEVKISTAHFYRIANGRAVPKFDIVVALAEIFEVDAGFFAPVSTRMNVISSRSGTE